MKKKLISQRVARTAAEDEARGPTLVEQFLQVDCLTDL